LWDRYPVSEGHLLIVTNRHVADWFEATPDEQAALTAALRRGRAAIRERFRADGYNIGVNSGVAAGQTVPHLHVHLIPRVAGDVADPRGGVRQVIPARANYWQEAAAGVDLHSAQEDGSLLVRGGEHRLLPRLCQQLDRAERADFAIAFILSSGVELLREHLRDLLRRGGRLRILTGDYLGVTDPDALVGLLDLEGSLELRVYETNGDSFHPKAYLFHGTGGEGTAFVGSSNLTRPALVTGLEWNYRVLRSGADEGFRQVTAAFEELFADRRTKPVDREWIEAYRARRPLAPSARVPEVVEEPPLAPPEPHAIQQEALAALQATRAAGNQAGLVVLATGLGKTWLAAFDSARSQFRRVLFVAHREEILDQALQTFRRIRPRARLGLYNGREKTPDAEVLFASIQTLGRVKHLRQFARDEFDYVVVDEFHHASARTYRQLIDHFTPRFLLGLTATPERMDGGDLLSLCQENLVYRSDLVSGIEAGLLCPFRYFGVPDEVDYANIPWRSARFDEQALTDAVATTRRAANALEQLRKHGGRRTIGFCCSQRHADFMADYLTSQGVRAAAVHTGPRSAPRATALEALSAGDLDVLLAVDMFNEGLDLPTIDTVLMLRPTESSTIWLQQFGRGLRKAENKRALTVIDYIGNHRTFLVKVRTLLEPLLGRLASDVEIGRALREIRAQTADLPPGCQVTYDLETIEILESILRNSRRDDDAIVSFYEDFQERHGTRPTAVELYHSGYNPRALASTHGSWTQFLRSRDDLSEAERSAIDVAGDFLKALETMPMSKSFKMVTLLAMLNQDRLPGEIGIEDLTSEFGRILRRSKSLRDEAGENLSDATQLRKLIVSNPIAAWTGGKGTSGERYFDYAGGRFGTNFAVSAARRQEVQALTREIVDWRLADYLNRRSVEGAADGFRCRVLHAGGRPILKLPDRRNAAAVPEGWVTILAGDRTYEANFVKEFVNVVRTERSSERNELPELLQTWFGPTAGLPGTRFEVTFQQEPTGWRMRPSGGGDGAQVWNHYMREDIPRLFGLPFSTAIWNQGFVVQGSHLFLLVTLEKGSLSKEHRYEDRFVSAEEFQWQSQNRTRRQSRHGQLMIRHQEKGMHVHLFVRKRKTISGKATPFVYCGEVDFASWDGDEPISVKWHLRAPVPPTARKMLDVPEE
jgi:superfamily II DNA or RNA helicase/HKD family nuclease/diadenosine tetraphosphate (Ap4A) HIT family hydrolase